MSCQLNLEDEVRSAISALTGVRGDADATSAMEDNRQAAAGSMECERASDGQKAGRKVGRCAKKSALAANPRRRTGRGWPHGLASLRAGTVSRLLSVLERSSK